MRHLTLGLFFLAACQSGKTGLAYIDNGSSFEASIFRTNENVPVGLRASVGQVWLPERWASLYGDSTVRYALGPYVQIGLPYGFYIEPKAEAAYYPDLGTPFELEAGTRFGWRWKSFEIFYGGRVGLGNGYRHERMGEWEHFPAGWHPELGLVWSFGF
ncbi:MAG: hypothetical protein MN733_36640 [Nitrososphaera sp.]|nr:hypothetical protein [Nitrososphaera sp.]